MDRSTSSRLCARISLRTGGVGAGSGGGGIARIVAALAPLVCAAPAFGQDETAQRVGEMTIQDMARWVAEHQGSVTLGLSVVSVFIVWKYRVLRVKGLDAGGRDVSPIPAVMWLFAAAATLFAFLLGQDAVRAFGLTGNGAIGDEAIRVLASAGTGAIFGSGMLWFVGRQAGNAGVKPDWADVPIGIGIFASIYPLVVLGGIVGTWIARGPDAVDQDPLAHKTLQLIAQNRGDPWIWLLVGVLVILVPIVEELIYRVYLQSSMLKLLKSRWAAVLVTGLLFVAMHWPVLPEGGKHAVVPLFLLAVSMGAAYERTGRLGVPITMHACFNAMNLLFAFMIEPIVR